MSKMPDYTKARYHMNSRARVVIVFVICNSYLTPEDHAERFVETGLGFFAPIRH